jgi:hypothetical protein
MRAGSRKRSHYFEDAHVCHLILQRSKAPLIASPTDYERNRAADAVQLGTGRRWGTKYAGRAMRVCRAAKAQQRLARFLR